MTSPMKRYFEGDGPVGVLLLDESFFLIDQLLEAQNAHGKGSDEANLIVEKLQNSKFRMGVSTAPNGQTGGAGSENPVNRKRVALNG